MSVLMWPSYRLVLTARPILHNSPSNPTSLVAAQKRRKQQDDSSESRESSIDSSRPVLSDYLEFGRLMGEQPEDVQQQLEANGVIVNVDDKSADYLVEWKAEKDRSYKLFEAVTKSEAGGVYQSSALLRNKNRVQTSPEMNPKEVARYKERHGFRNDAVQKKLAKNRGRAIGLPTLIGEETDVSGGNRTIEKARTGGTAETQPTSAFNKALGGHRKQVSSNPSAEHYKTKFTRGVLSKKPSEGRDISAHAVSTVSSGGDYLSATPSSLEGPSSPSSTSDLGLEADEDVKSSSLGKRRARCIRKAWNSLKSDNIEDMVIIRVNSAGAMATNTRFYGFIPLSLLADAHICRVLAEEKALLASGWKPRGLDGDQKWRLRRQALGVLVGRRTRVAVVEVHEESGKVVLSEKKAKKLLLMKGERLPHPPSYLFEAASKLIGETVLGIVTKYIRGVGFFVEFPLPQELLPINAETTPCHLASQSIDDDWEETRSPYPARPPVLAGVLPLEDSDITSGQVHLGDSIRVAIASVDTEKYKVFLHKR